MANTESNLRTWRPDVDIVEGPEAFWLWADLPGVDESSVKVKLEDETLSIQGRVTHDENLQASHVERPIGHFAHQFTVSSEVDAEAIEAKMKHGVLELRLPKAAHIRPRQIEIQKG